MATKPTASRRKFCDAWDEIEYLYHKILHWFYPLRDRRRALAFCMRLKVLLKKVASQHEAIFGEECWSLLYEVQGDLPKAIKYRESEIKLIKHLWEISRGTPGEDFIFKQYDASDLSDRMDLLAILYHDAGDLDKALSVVRESEQFCKAHGIRFDGKDLLRDYLAEKKQFARGVPARAAKRNRNSA
jgi:hypothetical protein